MTLNKEVYKNCRNVAYSKRDQSSSWEEAAKQNSASFEKFLTARKLLIDAGDNSLVNPRSTKEGVPILGSYEFNPVV